MSAVLDGSTVDRAPGGDDRSTARETRLFLGLSECCSWPPYTVFSWLFLLDTVRLADGKRALKKRPNPEGFRIILTIVKVCRVSVRGQIRLL